MTLTRWMNFDEDFHNDMFAELDVRETERPKPCMYCTGRGRRAPKLSEINPPKAAFYEPKEGKHGKRVGRGRAQIMKERASLDAKRPGPSDAENNSIQSSSSSFNCDPAQVRSVTHTLGSDGNSANSSSNPTPTMERFPGFGPRPVQGQFQDSPFGSSSSFGNRAFRPVARRHTPEKPDVQSLNDFPALSPAAGKSSGGPPVNLNEKLSAINFKSIAASFSSNGVSASHSFPAESATRVKPKKKKSSKDGRPLCDIRVTNLPPMLDAEQENLLHEVFEGYGEMHNFDIVTGAKTSVANISFDNKESCDWAKECIEDSEDSLFPGHELQVHIL